MESKIDQIKNKMVIKSCSTNLDSVSEDKSEELKKYGLSYFVQALLKEEAVNLDFVAELIASYNPKKHTATISGRNLYVTKDALTAALKLPPDTNVNVDEDDEDAIDFDDEEVDEFERFLLDFVMTSMYLHSDEKKVAMLTKIYKMSDCLMNGRPKDFDFSGFMWLLVENEILKGTDIQDCYYAQHMQCLIRDQLSDLFVVTHGGGDGDGDDGGDGDGDGETRSAPVESEKQFKKVYQRRRKGGTASGSGSRGHDVNSGSPSSASSTSRGHDVNPGSPSCASSTSEIF